MNKAERQILSELLTQTKQAQRLSSALDRPLRLKAIKLIGHKAEKELMRVDFEQKRDVVGDWTPYQACLTGVRDECKAIIQCDYDRVREKLTAARKYLENALGDSASAKNPRGLHLSSPGVQGVET